MKKLFLLLAAATLVAACSKDAEEFDDFPQIVDGPTITVETPGTLAELLAQFDAEAITELTVKGNLNSDDIYALRDNLPNLAVLDLESVDLEDLPGGSFYEKTTLTTVRLPKNLKTIGTFAFSGCSGLTSVVLPKNLTTIGKSAFYGCSGLTGELVIPQGVTSIERAAFNLCRSLTSVVIPQGVTSIGEYAFSGCHGLTGDLVLPKNLTTIGDCAFLNCENLTGKLVIPQGVTRIEERSFKGCVGLTSVTISQGVEYIDKAAFQNCSGLTSITFPQSMKMIYCTAFHECNNVTAVYCKATEPPIVWKWVSDTTASGDDFNYAATLYVPVGMAETYKSAAIWKKFENIVEMEF
ncbi:MAG: leucine-rich repeat domain-containing protein [Alistipes sp.]|nr:leucine-rich repeat domain-containing protein [Alistipes sp.]